VQKSIEVDLALITYYDALLRDLALTIVKTAKHHDAQTLYLLQTVPGIGKILSSCCSTRFMISSASRVCRILPPTVVSSSVPENLLANAPDSGHTIGHAHLKWAFSEAAVLFLRDNPAAQKFLARLEKKHSKGKALTILAHKVARAVYSMLKRQTAFALHTFLQGKGGEPVSSTPNWTATGCTCSATLATVSTTASLHAPERLGRSP